MGTILRKVGASETWKTRYDNRARNALHTVRESKDYTTLLRGWHPDGLGVPAPMYIRDADGVLFGRHTHPDITKGVARGLAAEEPPLDVVFVERGIPKGFTLIVSEVV